MGIEIVREEKIPRKFGSIRTIGEKTHKESKSYRDFVNLLNVSPAIRGDELKSFVTDHSPVHRLEEVLQCLKLNEPNGMLVTSRTYLQERYRELEILSHENTILNSRLASITNQEVQKYDEKKIVKFVNNSLLLPLTSDLKLTGINQFKSIIDKLRAGIETFEKSTTFSNKSSDQKSVDSYQNAIETVDGLYQIIQNFNKLHQDEQNFKQQIDVLNSTISKVSQILKTEIQQLIDQLHDPMNEYYKYIQGDIGQTIKLQIDSDKDTGQEHLKLVIDFDSNRKNVQPSGYLSNSHMHSFALAFRLASVKVLNPNVPILILDDIVTSFDAEYRSRVASLLVEKFEDFQIILLTHDEQFYQVLMDKMGSDNWTYNRIIRFNKNYGPVFRNYESMEEQMMRHWDEGDSALHLVRRMQEKFAKRMVMDLGIKMPVLASNTTRNHARSKLFEAIRDYLVEKNIFVPKVGGIRRNVFQYFIDGLLENAAVHIHDETFGRISIGDERIRWDEYKKFEDLFICNECGHNRFVTRDNKMVCKQKKCGKEFTVDESVVKTISEN